MPSLFDPIQIGAVTLKNRIVMAPLTRARSGVERVPGPMVAEYYAQRAGAGLILSEATSVTPLGVGYADTPGIWSDEQVEGWKLTTRAVHEAGGLIFLQLWHVGRISDPSFHDGAAPVSASAIAARGDVSLLRPKRPYPVPRALSLDEIAGVVEAYRQGAENAKRAGFDGVELHGANGYLLDQFLQDGSNKRTDQYGGPIENRARLMLEAVDAAISVFGADRVGLHIAPRGDSHDMGDSDLLATFSYVAKAMRDRGLAFLMARERQGDDSIGPRLKAIFGGPYIVNEGFTGETGQAALDAGAADAVGYGKDFISNPDLPARLKAGAPLTPWNMATFYSPGPEGYVDYPALETVDA
ncbi:2,4-dienoyl-CoA reductase-like NADH-dependent reductase (Old Yellow Enzyme family) [Caulobacter ginsengisoli]|uniref:2,4-dienoyl-CoA reductase-like NADH-dependent reductase (Old Yellow Enzyme family) n=1 Tax=Caulobacter ginsengisoli TaxID=400775 RepID=A0ABU0IT34_9CAUL|nr:alkene reductase [Caulobacter ginsengisoli]MDQ0465159.1 2,4-dienoyl-CoA reductase-like NADH-dependent reductase (Old Yellow Enzyme family) [Caulobacter ginsengisoli]